MTQPELLYFFDPLCGWCYASAPALAGLVEEYGDQVRLMPVGLFDPPRPIEAIADHAWRNDQRIAEMTGQPVTEAYHRNVLQVPDGVFTSAPLTLALCVLGEHDRRLEPRFLHAAQVARYMEGRDTSRSEEVVRVAVSVAAEHGVALDPATLLDQLNGDEALKARAADRMTAARTEMQFLAGSGVPQLLVRRDGRATTLNGSDLYGGKQRLLDALQQSAL